MNSSLLMKMCSLMISIDPDDYDEGTLLFTND